MLPCQAAIVYVAVNLVNDKMYVGATEKGLPVRQRKHLANARRGQLSKFYTAIRKHGPEKFKFLIIQKCDDFWDALKHERRLIEMLQPEYNMTDGGGGVKGFKFSETSRKKMSDAKIGKPGLWARQEMPDDLRKKIGDMRRAEKGRKITDPIWLSKLQINAAKANAGRRRKVNCVTHSLSFDSVTAAAKHYGVTTGHITQWCKGAVPRNGLKFEYLDGQP